MNAPKETNYLRKNKFMLNCDEAAFLASVAELEKIPFGSRLSLRMHLMACKHCKNYARQMRLISRNISQKAINVEKGIFTQRLSMIEKTQLAQLINSNLK